MASGIISMVKTGSNLYHHQYKWEKQFVFIVDMKTILKMNPALNVGDALMKKRSSVLNANHGLKMNPNSVLIVLKKKNFL